MIFSKRPPPCGNDPGIEKQTRTDLMDSYKVAHLTGNLYRRKNVDLFVTDQDTLKADGWLPGSFEIKDGHTDAVKLNQLAVKFVDSVLDFNPDATEQLDIRDRHLGSIDNLGGKARKNSSKLVRQLREPLDAVEKQFKEQSWLASSLNNLEAFSRKLDPRDYEVKETAVTRLLERIPFMPTPLRRYFSLYEPGRKEAEQILSALGKVADVLEKDIELFKSRSRDLSDYCTSLGKAVYLSGAIARCLRAALENDIPDGDPRVAFIEGEMLPRVRGRLPLLKLQLDFNRQCLTALTVVFLNTEELNKAMVRVGESLVKSFNQGGRMARERFNYPIDLLEESPAQPGDGPCHDVTRPWSLAELSAAFSQTVTAVKSLKEFMGSAGAAVRQSVAELPRQSDALDAAFAAARQHGVADTGAGFP